jgi:hypothetical protein
MQEFDRRGGMTLAVIMLLFVIVIFMTIYYMFIDNNPALGKEAKTFFLIFAFAGILWIIYMFSASR